MDSHTTKARPRAAKLIAEFGVIVVGVLMALAVDAAWEGREERARLRTHLGQIQSDLLILTANPLEDIKNTRSLEVVISEGEVVDRDALVRSRQESL